MKKRFLFAKRAAAAVAAIAVAALMLLPASAVRAADGYTPVAGGVTQFDKYFVRNTGADVPDHVDFKYTIASADASEDILAAEADIIKPGPDPDKIIVKLTEDGDDVDDNISTNGVFLVPFEKNDTATAKDDKPDTDYVKDLDDGEEYVKKTAYLDLKNVTFSEPGIYRYKITESNPDNDSDPDIWDDPCLAYDTPDRYLDVYVVDTGNEAVPALSVSSYVLHANKAAVTDTTADHYGEAESDYKSQGYTNEYIAYNLSISKKVTGNQGSKDKYFEFVFEISDATPGAVLAVDYILADRVIPVNPNSATTIEFVGNTAPETDPGNTDPGNTDPADPEPGNTDPGNTDPGNTDPADPEPGNTDPGNSDPGNTDPADPEPGNTDPGNTDPADPEPGNGEGGNDTSQYTLYAQPDTITVGADGKATQKLYLNHGDKITIKGIPAGATYKVTESYEEYRPFGSIDSKTEVDDGEGPEPFKAAIESGSSDTQVTMSVLDGGSEPHTLLIKKEDDKKFSATYTNVYTHAEIDFENNKPGIIPTGVILSVAVPAVIGIIVIAAIVLLLVKSRKRQLDEE